MANANTKNTPAISVAISDDHTTLTLGFANQRQLVLSTGQLSMEIIAQALAHGLKQKLVDAAAISRNTETGRAASIDDKFDAVKEVYDRLLAGEWNKKREGGVGGSGGLLFRALCRMYAGKKSEADIKGFLDSKTDAEKAALRKNSKVAAIIEEIRAESDKGGASSDELLAGLEG